MNQMNNSRDRRVPSISNSRVMGVVALIALLFVFQVATFVVQKIRKAAPVPQPQQVQRPDAPALFGFDPNTVTSDSLQMLGFSVRQAQTILKYREKGGKFRVRGDFARMYVVDSARYAALAPYILLPDSLPARKVQKTAQAGTKLAAGGKNVQRKGNFDAGHDTLGKRADTAAAAVYGSRVEANRYLCNLNTADSAALVRLYGIGGYYANRILEYRERLGGSFVHKRQLLEIEGFSQQRYNRIENNIVVEADDIKGFSLLGADRKLLERHPYIGPYAARGILMYLELKGKDMFRDELQLLQELVKEHVITENNALRLREYLLHL